MERRRGRRVEYKEAGCVERDADVTEGGHGERVSLTRCEGASYPTFLPVRASV